MTLPHFHFTISILPPNLTPRPAYVAPGSPVLRPPLVGLPRREGHGNPLRNPSTTPWTDHRRDPIRTPLDWTRSQRTKLAPVQNATSLAIVDCSGVVYVWKEGRRDGSSSLSGASLFYFVFFCCLWVNVLVLRRLGSVDLVFVIWVVFFAMAQFWFYVLSLTTISSGMAIFTGGETDVGSPLRVAQCRATCLERVSSIFENNSEKTSRRLCGIIISLL